MDRQLGGPTRGTSAKRLGRRIGDGDWVPGYGWRMDSFNSADPMYLVDTERRKVRLPTLITNPPTRGIRSSEVPEPVGP